MSRFKKRSRRNKRGRTVMIDRRRSKRDNNCNEPDHSEEVCCETPRQWNALDPTENHPLDDDTVVQDEDAGVKSNQESLESITIKDSSDVQVTSTDTQAALNVQAALQAAIALVISISIADSSTADAITQDLLAEVKSNQTNKQQVYIENSRGVNVSTTDTDIAVNIQILLQILLVLVVRLDIL